MSNEPCDVDQRDVWMCSCWVCKVAISYAETGAGYGFKQRAWCRPCWERRVNAVVVGQVEVKQLAPELSDFAVACFGDMAGDEADGNAEGRDFFPCPEQSLHVFRDDAAKLAAFNGRGRELRDAELVVLVPGTDPARYRLSDRGRGILVTAGCKLWSSEVVQ